MNTESSDISVSEYGVRNTTGCMYGHPELGTTTLPYIATWQARVDAAVQTTIHETKFHSSINSFRDKTRSDYEKIALESVIGPRASPYQFALKSISLTV